MEDNRMELTFLNLSDLHIQQGNLSDVKIVLNALFNDISNQNAQFDFILFNGDLINNASKGEFEFKIAKEEFIEPLLKVTGLTINEFLIVPGNHDINRSKISEFLDADLTSKFSDREKLNKFIDNIDQPENKLLLKRLDDYNNFVESIYSGKNAHCIHSTPLFSTFIFSKGKYKIGIACLNSAWGAVGGSSDLGKLLIGERQIDAAYQDLKDCDLRIAMFHHPLEWLKEFDREAIQDILYVKFNMVFNGHLHVQNQNLIVHEQYNTLLYRCGSLYDNRIYNGYAVSKVNMITKDAEMFLRQYFDRRRVFDKAINVVEEGYVRYNLDFKKENNNIRKNIEIKKKISANMKDEINSKLISYIAPDTYAPKSIDEIYVTPLLSTEPENASNSDNQDFHELYSIVNGSDNILFVGRKEYGKTTLINYISDLILSRPGLEDKVPVILDYRELPSGRNIFEKAINSFLIDHGVTNQDLESNLKQGTFILLVDNFNLSDKKLMEKLIDFARNFKKTRFIFTMNEDILKTIKISEVPEFNIPHKVFYMYSYRRNQVRKLVEKWFWTQHKHEQELILDTILKTQRLVGLPRTPLTFSLLLSIYEKQSNYVPINEATLVDRFVKSIIELPIVDEIKYETIDYTIKSDYLSFLASIMRTRDSKYIGELEYDRVSLEYFQSKGLEYVNIEKFKTHFFRKGILVKHDQKVYFRLMCFYELFLAKYISENSEFRMAILTQESFMDYKHELIYYSGLNRKDQILLDFVQEQVNRIFNSVSEMVDIKKFCDLPIGNNLLEYFETNEAFQKKMDEMSLTEERKDELLDSKSENNEYYVENQSQNDKQNEYLGALELFSNIIKNSELLTKDSKKSALISCINKFSLLTVLYSNLLFEKLDEIKDNLNHNSLEESEFRYILTTGIPLIVQSLMVTNIGSPKLKTIIEESIKEVETDLEKFMTVCLYGDLRLEDYLSKFEYFIKTNNSKVLIEATIIKLLYYRLFYYKKPSQEQQLLSLLADLTIKKSGGNKLNKSKVMQILDSKSKNGQLREDII